MIIAVSFVVLLVFAGAVVAAVVGAEDPVQASDVAPEPEDDSLRTWLPTEDALVGWELTRDSHRPNEPSPWVQPGSACASEPEFQTIDTMENHVREWTTTQRVGMNGQQVDAVATLAIHVARLDSSEQAHRVAHWFSPFAARCLPNVLGADFPIRGGVPVAIDGLPGSAYGWRSVHEAAHDRFWGHHITGFVAHGDRVWGIDLEVQLAEGPLTDQRLAAIWPGHLIDSVAVAAITERIAILDDGVGIERAEVDAR